MPRRWKYLSIALPLVAQLAACGGGSHDTTPFDAAPPDVSVAALHASDVPIDGLSMTDLAAFLDGDNLFDLPLGPNDGLGPLYVESSCGQCHQNASRGPGVVQKMAIVEADGITASPDQSALLYGHNVKRGLAAGATTPITPPTGPNVKLTQRFGPPVLGRGYIEAVDDAEIARVETEQAARTDGIHGVRNMLPFASIANTDTTFDSHQMGDIVVGRFALKARVATLDDFAADAFQNDMGITTPMRPTEPPNPDGLTDDLKPGIDLTIDFVNRIAFYLRRIAIPVRAGLTDRGTQLFSQVNCAVCHVPTLHTRADYPIPQMANIDAAIYSDLLLHDMGPDLADGQTDGMSTSLQWRTAPLIGLRFQTNYMHDARAHGVAAAIMAHGGEAAGAVQAFQALSADDQQLLLTYVEAL